MKLKSIVLAISVLTFTNCKKKTTGGGTTTPTKVCYVSTFKDSIISTSSTTVENNTLTWDASDEISKIVTTYSGGGETLIITRVGTKISKIEFKDGSSVLTKTRYFTYTGNNVTKIMNDNVGGAKDSTLFTYNSSNQLTSAISGDNTDISLSNISWSNGNINTVTLRTLGVDIGTVTFAFDNKPNYRKKFIMDDDPGQFLLNINTNNLLTGISDVDIAAFSIVKGDKLFDLSYTYNSDNTVSMAVTNPTKVDKNKTIRSITYNCK